MKERQCQRKWANLGLLRDQRHYRPRDGSGADIGTTIQQSFFDQWGRLIEERTEIPDHIPGGTGRLKFESVYTLRDDGQPSTVHHPTGTNKQNTYKVDYTYNSRTGQAETLTEQGAGGQQIVTDVAWNNAGQVKKINFGSDSLDAQSRWVYDPHTLRLTVDTFGTNNFVTRHRHNTFSYDNNANITSIVERRNDYQVQCFT